MSGFNGYRSWAQWNVSLWLNNDEGWYREMRRMKRLYGCVDGAKHLLQTLHDHGMDKTPDGARYTVTGIRAAMVGA